VLFLVRAAVLASSAKNVHDFWNEAREHCLSSPDQHHAFHAACSVVTGNITRIMSGTGLTRSAPDLCKWLHIFYLQYLAMPSDTPTPPFNGPFSGTTRVSRYQKGKPIWMLLKQDKVSGRQITTPAPHHSVFLQAGCPSCRPINSVKALPSEGPVN